MTEGATSSESRRVLYSITELCIRKGTGSDAFVLEVPALEIEAGARVALAGPSGCGKSSLVDVLALLAQPAWVDVFFFDPGPQALDLAARMKGRDSSFLAGLRARHIGFVPQVGGLLPGLTVRQNIELPCRLAGIKSGEWIRHLMTSLGLSAHGNKKPGALSVGERQRCAIARALAHRPAVVIADEPTGALDPHNADRVLRVFCEMAQEVNSTLLVVSHDVDRIRRFDLDVIPHGFRRDGDRAVSVFGGR